MKINDLVATATTTTTTTTVAVATKSVLEKPLHELTEDDISQLTREDCRKYLKEKGMRRPSWNKSQAIQQVISLKSLLEPHHNRHHHNHNQHPHHPPSPSPSPLNPKLLTPNVNSNSSSSFKELSPVDVDVDVEVDADGSVSAVGEDGGLNQLTSSSEPAKDGECRPVSIRGTDASRLAFDQMTIFYSGGVNVYDKVPVDKQAQAIMHLAVNPIQQPQDERNFGNLTHWSSPCQLPSPSVKVNLSTQDVAASHSLLQGKIAEPNQHCRTDGSIFNEHDVECQSNRQVSLQRYFEKRKDRGKFKKRKIGSSLSGLEMYLNTQMRSPVTNGKNSQSNASSKSHLGIPCSSFGLIDNEQRNRGPSVDLNEKA